MFLNTDLVIVTEKFKTTRFEIIKKSNRLTFFKSNHKPITIIDRTLSIIYDNFINHFNKVNVNLIPEDYIFGFNFLNDNFILTDIVYKNSSILDLDILKKYSEILKTELVEIIYHGYLTESQINDLPDIDLILTSESKTVYIQKNGFTRSTKNADDLTSLAVLDFIEYFNTLENINYVLLESNYDEKYLELMNYIFCDYVYNNSHKYDNVLKFNNAEFSKNKNFDLNFSLITNLMLLNILRSNSMFIDLYKIIVGTFRKKKKKSTLMYSNIDYINDVYHKIDNKLKEFNHTAELVDFNEWLKIK